MRAHGLHNAYAIHDGTAPTHDTNVELPGRGWVPARPLGFNALKFRLQLAWGVFTGKYDALVWSGQERDMAKSREPARVTPWSPF